MGGRILPFVSDEELIQELLHRLGEDVDREGLRETPKRVIAAWRFWTSGNSMDPASVLKCFEDGSEGYDELVFQAGLPLHSVCEHHMAPISGMCHVAYVPNGRIVGLSKLSRLVDIFARRLTVQERMCNQIADALMEHLTPKGVGVVIQARHQCMESRGIQKVGTVTVTSALRGCVKNEPECRAEFMSLVTTSMQGVRTL